MDLRSILLIFISLHILCNAESWDDVHNLRMNIFESSKYSKLIRPNKDQTRLTEIKIVKLLLGVNEINEITQSLTSKAIFRIEWIDERLIWDETKFNVSRLSVDHKELWLPKITLSNGELTLKKLGSDLQSVEVTYDGHVVWEMGEVLVTDCILDITYFPFDRQICELKFTNWELRTVVKGGNSSSFNVLQSTEWSIISTAIDIDERDELDYNILLQRKPWIYIQNIVIPIILLSVLNMMTFLIPVDSGEKMGYTTSVFLAFTVFITETGSSLPTNSDSIPILGLYLTIQSVVGAFTIIITTIELRLFKRDLTHAIPGCLFFLARISLFCRCQPVTVPKIEEKGIAYKDSIQVDEPHMSKDIQSPDDNQEEEGQKGYNEINLTWPNICNIIDFFSFWLLFFMITTSTILLFALPITMQNSITLSEYRTHRATDIIDYWKT